jgi:chemotaxis protein CheC
VTDSDGKLLSESQLAVLRSSLHRGSANASKALSAWIEKPSVVEIDSLEQLPLEEATGVLPGGDQTICFCSMAMDGVISGEMILAFDDASGFALADMLLDRPPGSTDRWTEMALSAALETTNVVCCAYLNSLSRSLSDGSSELVPAPPNFRREFSESLMQFALMGQAVDLDYVIVAQTRFAIDGEPVSWTLLFMPDADSMLQLPELLNASRSER